MIDKEYIEKIKKGYVITDSIRGVDLKLNTTWGLFSPKEIDRGTRVLLEALDLKELREKSVVNILDLGCGYGVVGIVLARLLPQAEIHMVDTDFVAVEYAKKNAEINEVKNVNIYLSNGFNNVKDAKFDLVISNVPANVGKELLHIFLNDTYEYLNTKGKMCVVVISGLKEFIKRNLNEVFGNYEKVEEKKGYTVISATK